jgi:hypothetical protein
MNDNPAIFVSNFARQDSSGTGIIIPTQSFPVIIHSWRYVARFMTQDDFFTVDVNPQPNGWDATQFIIYWAYATGDSHPYFQACDTPLLLPPGSRVTYNALITAAHDGFRGVMYWSLITDNPVTEIEAVSVAQDRSPLAFLRRYGI